MIHHEEQVKQIADSISEFGFTNPILVDENLEILAGHGRREAAMQLKLIRVPCIILDHLTDAQKMAYRLADNKLARNSDFEWQLVSDELKALQESGYDLTLTGFRDFEVEPLLQGKFTAPELSDGDGGEFGSKHQIVLTDDQYKVVMQAIAKVKQGEGDDDMSDGRCMELICADYLAGA
jgi:ParB-like chromosome segregation protein Spo0J